MLLLKQVLFLVITIMKEAINAINTKSVGGDLFCCYLKPTYTNTKNKKLEKRI